jgi:small multidrug resistance pump
MGWIFLALAIGFEIAGTIALKLSDGMTRLVYVATLPGFYGLSFLMMALAMKTVPLSTAYAIWSAVGIGVLSVVGFFWFEESASGLKIAALALIVVGVVTLYFAETATAGA